ncbi:MAG: hypothetical protein MZV64_60400 [Ignavibacteriales bacterium]|nr:hypothetical protein [Ignavibacteriales bacterium]
MTQVNLLLPQKRTAAPRRQLLEVGWWMIPVGLLMTWIFVSTAVLVGDVFSAADSFGLLDDTTSASGCGFVRSRSVDVNAGTGRFAGRRQPGMG